MINADRLHLRKRTQTGNGHIIEFLTSPTTISANTVLTEACSLLQAFFNLPLGRKLIEQASSST
ncbi:hypothetical protein AN958_07089 [Leucoagaricus sp. SymC.cos]|nr:hypothetical protein AN958_07089 [Leucoagaricus sp. SymC.cos]